MNDLTNLIEAWKSRIATLTMLKAEAELDGDKKSALRLSIKLGVTRSMLVELKRELKDDQNQLSFLEKWEKEL